MKKTLLFCIAAMSSVVACVKESAENISGGSDTENVTFSTYCVQTKTVLSDNTKIYWYDGDRIAVKGETSPFTCDLEEPSQQADFSGNVETADVYYAVYPHGALTSWSGTVAAMTLPSKQSAQKGSFADGLHMAAAKTTSQEKSFTFENILGYVKFTIGPSSGSIRSVEVTATGDEALAGSFTVDCASDTPEAVVSTGVSTVVLSSETVLEEGDYYIALLPGEYSHGLQFTFTDIDGATASASYNKALTMEAGHINPIGTVKGLKWSSTVIWRGSSTLEDWSGNQDLAWGGYDWSTVKPGELLRIYGTPVDVDADWWLLNLSVGDGWGTLAGVPGQYGKAVIVQETLTAEMIDHLVEKSGLVIRGDGYILKKVEIIHDVAEENVIWSDGFTFEGWNGMQGLAWGGYDWSSVKAGQTLVVYLSDAQDGWCYSLRVADGWANISGMAPQFGDDVVTKIVLTQEVLDQLTSKNGLIITGDKCTVSKLALK
ncbi:MAG: hypothetical protein E7124_07725 [Bacteroidales bacterium]|nr:hypothetical protein [Bacteroidales bacterium]